MGRNSLPLLDESKEAEDDNDNNTVCIWVTDVEHDMKLLGTDASQKETGDLARPRVAILL